MIQHFTHTFFSVSAWLWCYIIWGVGGLIYMLRAIHRADLRDLKAGILYTLIGLYVAPLCWVLLWLCLLLVLIGITPTLLYVLYKLLTSLHAKR